MPNRLSDTIRLAFDVCSLLRSERWSAERIRAFQQQRLVAQLRHAVTHVPYYRSLGIAAGDIHAVEDLSRFPRLTKAIVQRERERLLSERPADAPLFHSLTSGSSGEPTTTWFDADSWRLCRYALKIRRTLGAGFPLGQRLLVFDETRDAVDVAPRPRTNRYGLFRETRLSVFLSIEEQYAALLGARPTAIYGSPSGIADLCDHAARHGLELPGVRVVFLSAELIGDAVRTRIERAFGCRIIGVYGSTEFKEIAHECGQRRYHVNFESVWLETDEEADQPTPRLLITSLVNRAMPLIRFDIGDYARLGTDPCGCGRSSPWLTDIAGREAEFLSLADGRRISPYLLTTAVETTPGLLRYQFLRHAGGRLELRAMLSGTGEAERTALAALRERLREALGESVEVEVRRVDSIDRTAAGKHRVVVQAP